MLRSNNISSFCCFGFQGTPTTSDIRMGPFHVSHHIPCVPCFVRHVGVATLACCCVFYKSFYPTLHCSFKAKMLSYFFHLNDAEGAWRLTCFDTILARLNKSDKYGRDINSSIFFFRSNKSGCKPLSYRFQASSYREPNRGLCTGIYRQTV